MKDSGDALVSATDDVINYVKAGVRNGRLAPGQRLTEAEISEATGASRGYVREALKHLAAQGFVVARHNRGTRIRELSEEELRHNFAAREVIEGLAASLVARSGGAEQLQEILSWQNELDEAAAASDTRKFFTSLGQWHISIVRNSGNPFLEVFMDRLFFAISQLQNMAFHSAALIEELNSDHRKVTAAIVSGDAEGAERLMRGLIACSGNQMLSVLEEQQAS